MESGEQRGFPPLEFVRHMGGGVDGRGSKVYGPSKRRTASADRIFPVGCGRNAAVIIRAGDQPSLPMAVAATAENGSRLAFLEKSNGEHRPHSAEMSRQDAPMVEGAGGEQIAADELEPEEYSGCMEAADGEGQDVVALLRKPVKGEAVEEPNSTGRGEVDSQRTERDLALLIPADNMLNVGISKLFGPAKMRRVSSDRCFPPGCGRTAAAVQEPGAAQEGGSERTARNLGHQKSPASMSADDMLSGEISIVFGPSKKRGVSVERHFPAGCGRTAAAARREEPGATTAVWRSAESHAKKKPEEAKSMGTKVELHKARVVHLGNQAQQSSTEPKRKLLAFHHSPVGTGKNAGKLLERSHGGQARGGGGRGTNDHPAGLASGKRPPLAAKSPLLPRGGAAGKGGEASEGATAPKLRADRIVMVLMAAGRRPLSAK